MANVIIKDGNSATKYIKATGVGTDGDPYEIVHGLPTGASTSTLQTTGNGYLSNIDNKLGAGLTITSGSVGIKEQSMLYTSGSVGGAGDNALVGQPGAGSRIVVSGYQLQLEVATETFMYLKDGSTIKRRFQGAAKGDFIEVRFPVGREWKLSENTALNLALSTASQVGYTIDYYLQST